MRAWETAADTALPYVQVPGCGFDLTESPYYYKRHRVCEGHMKAKTVALDGDVCR